MTEPEFEIRPARPNDAAAITRLIRALARYEKLEAECAASEPVIAHHLFGRHPYAEALVAERGGDVVGFALFFHNYSTFRARPGIHLEDIFVEPEHRRRGIGRALLERVLDLARARRCGRVEWMVLDWNEPALEFYRHAFGAEARREWLLNRVTLADDERPRGQA